MKRSIKISKLISASALNQITDEEQNHLDAWINENPEHEKIYNKVTDVNFLQHKLDDNNKVNYVSAFFKIEDSIRKRKRRRYMYSFLRYVSAIFIPILVCVGVLFFEKEEIKVENNISQNKVLVGSSKARLFLDDGSVVDVSETASDTIIQENDAHITTSKKGIKYISKDSNSKKLHYNTLVIPRGGEYSLQLADGTIVWLNSESRLKYPVDFNSTERRVFLTGEGYFDVAHDANKPFVVDVSGSDIKVLGTSFNVRSYKAEKAIVTTLVEGRVNMNSSNNNQVMMFPGEQCVLKDNGDMNKRKVDVSLYTSWKDGRLKFKHQSLEEIMNTLYRWYDIDVFYITPSVKYINFSGDVRRYDDFEKVINLLELTGNIKFEVKGKQVYIKEVN